MATVGRSTPRYGIGLALLVGAAVAVALGVYANVHDPTGRSLVSLFFTRTINLKVWFATAAMGLALFQVTSGAKMEGKLGSGHGPRWLPRAHRASGTVAFLLTVVVAYHCLWALGFQADYTRVLIHGIGGMHLLRGARHEDPGGTRTRDARLCLRTRRRIVVLGAHRDVAHERAVVLPHGWVPGVLTMKTKSYDRLIGCVLALGWIAFVLLLAGVGADLITN